MKFCCMDEVPVAAGDTGQGQLSQGMLPQCRDFAEAPRGAGQQQEQAGRAVRDTAGQGPCRLTHFPSTRARMHWPDSAGAEEKIAPRFRRRSSFWSCLWHGLSSGASKGARNMCWSLSGGDKA